MGNVKEIILKIINYLPGGKHFTGYYFLSKNHLTKSGWKKSNAQKLPIDQAGRELPWFTYSCIYFLEPRLDKEFSVFEYGSGNSTIWFSKKTQKVVSVEHDEKWYLQMNPRLSKIDKVQYYLKSLTSKTYQEEILNYNQEFDIIVLDGRERVDCCLNSLKALKENGIILWDNSDRKEYSKGYEFLISHGFKRLDFYGMGPISVHSWCTSIFYKDNNCLKI